MNTRVILAVNPVPQPVAVVYCKNELLEEPSCNGFFQPPPSFCDVCRKVASVCKLHDDADMVLS